MRLFSAFDIWFRPKGFESERLYERLGAVLIKRYVPTGGDRSMSLHFRTLRRKKPRISRGGSRHPRRALYMPALVAMRREPYLRAFYHRLLARGKG